MDEAQPSRKKTHRGTRVGTPNAHEQYLQKVRSWGHKCSAPRAAQSAVESHIQPFQCPLVRTYNRGRPSPIEEIPQARSAHEYEFSKWSRSPRHPSAIVRAAGTARHLRNVTRSRAPPPPPARVRRATSYPRSRLSTRWVVGTTSERSVTARSRPRATPWPNSCTNG